MNEFSGIRAGRKAPFAQIGEWVITAPITPQAKALYVALAAHENHSRWDGQVWPGLTAVARMLGFKNRRSVSRYVKELADLGAIDVHRETTPMGWRQVYTIHELPPEGYDGVMTIGEFHKRLREQPPSKPEAKASAKGSQEGGSLPVDSDGSLPTACGGSLPTDSGNQTKGTIRTKPDEGAPRGACSRRSPASRSSAKSANSKTVEVLHGRDLVGLPAKTVTQKLTSVWHSVLQRQGGEEPRQYGGGWREDRELHPVGSQLKDFFHANDIDPDDLVTDEQWLNDLLTNVRAHARSYAQHHPKAVSKMVAVQQAS